jgi:hypothetical protein
MAYGNYFKRYPDFTAKAWRTIKMRVLGRLYDTFATRQVTILNLTRLILEEAEMNKNPLSKVLYCGLLFLLAACGAAGQSLNAAMVGAGDTINGMGLTTGVADAPPLWGYCSSSYAGSHIKTFNCRAPVMQTLAVGHIFLFADEILANLDWSELVWELSIDNQAVDLESFGTIDYAMPRIATNPSPVREVFVKATAWNVVLTNLNPGEHTLRFLAQSDTESYTWFVNLEIEGADITDISSVPFPPKS